MKGVVLAGGLGTRLLPLTEVTNKHLLPVYDRPMIYYPINTLVHAGIKDILVVTGGEHAGDFLKLLRNGKHLGVKHLEYAYQDGHGGIADALKLSREFADGGPIAVILGDNIFFGSIAPYVPHLLPEHAMVVLSKTPEPQRFGVPEFGPDGRLIQIVEKPKDPPSQFAVTGLYFYHSLVFDICEELRPSERGELEITDVNNAYIESGGLRHAILDDDVKWMDAGTFESIHAASCEMRDYA